MKVSIGEFSRLAGVGLTGHSCAMEKIPQVLCIGSVLWDIVGRAASHMEKGSDVPGRISRQPGGVALNIAMALTDLGVSVAILTAIGKDVEGRELLQAVEAVGVVTDYAYLSEDLPTDRYMAIEGRNGLIAAIADAHSLEATGDKILRPLKDGRLASRVHPFDGVITIDGNLTVDLLKKISSDDMFVGADLRIAPASPGKADRLRVLLDHKCATLYVNLEEANLLTHGHYDNSTDAANALRSIGVRRALVTNGAQAACSASPQDVITLEPPEVLVTRITGAGDTFMASHIAAEMRGADERAALEQALDGAATFISTEKTL